MKRLLGWALLLLFALILLSNVMHIRAEDPADGDDDHDHDDAETDKKEDAKDEPKEDSPASSEEPKDSTREDDKTGDEVIEDEDAVLKPSADVVATVYFPDFPSEKKFPIGTDVQLLLGIHNKGKSTFNVSFIGASLHSPFDLDYYIQNFSVKAVDELVEPGQEQTFDYSFRPDHRLEPLEFWLSAFVIYNNTDTNQIHQTVFLNGTIDLVEKPSDMNFRRVFTYFLAFAAAGLVGYIAWHVVSPKKSGSSERGTRDDDDKGGWVPAKVYSQRETSRVIRKRKDAPPPKKKEKEAGSQPQQAESPRAASS